MPSLEIEYFARRAATHEELAACANHPGSIAAHVSFALAYRAGAARLGPVTLSIVPSAPSGGTLDTAMQVIVVKARDFREAAYLSNH